MANMLTISILFIGFSIFSAFVIALTHFRNTNYTEQRIAQAMGLSLLAVLASLQLIHFAYLQYDITYIYQSPYHMLLFAVAPSFYLFSKPLLKAQNQIKPVQLLHALPIFIAPLLSLEWSLTISFTLGAGYLLWLARSVYTLRAQRVRFKIELMVLGSVFIIAIIVLIMGLSRTLLEEKLFFSLYASSIGYAFLLVSLVLNIKPQLSTDVVEAAHDTYQISTLANIDCSTELDKLQSLMMNDHIFQQTDLDLPGLAAKMNLSSHQLSELINTRLGIGFSRYIREYRVEAAKKMLLSEPSASVLSVGLSVGFTSQSNFYDAFREITGMTPGKFRKINTQNYPE